MALCGSTAVYLYLLRDLFYECVNLVIECMLVLLGYQYV